MTTPANLRGWGQGWPIDRSADMVWVRAAISGAKWQLHKDIAPIWKFLVDTCERRGYLFDYGPNDVDDDWGYANRPIRGKRVASNHSWGLAGDVDAQNYPMGTRLKPPQWMIDLFDQYLFDNGSSWSRPDGMHFEFRGWPSDARFLVAALAGHHIEGSPPPVPISVPAPPPPPRRKKPMFLMKGTAKPEIYVTDLIAKRHLKRKEDVGGAQIALQSVGFNPAVSTVDQAFLDSIPVQK